VLFAIRARVRGELLGQPVDSRSNTRRRHQLDQHLLSQRRANSDAEYAPANRDLSLQEEVVAVRRNHDLRGDAFRSQGALEEVGVQNSAEVEGAEYGASSMPPQGIEP
jgi:hypothetical protein